MDKEKKKSIGVYIGLVICFILFSIFVFSKKDSNNTENTINKKIESNIIELTDKTIIYVTHKIHKKMLQEFDDILVLSHGKLVEHGSFEDLLSKKNYFYHLFMNQ